jgi:large subunit ribosomal protein L13
VARDAPKVWKMQTPSISMTDAQRGWYVVDAEGKVLGRLASQIASVLRGKSKPTFTPHDDTGDFVVVINADKVVLTGKKEDEKIYWRYTGFYGGEKATVAKNMRATHPDRIITFAVQGMLPKTKLGRRMLKKLKVYAGDKHPHAAQKPQPLNIGK